MGGGASGKAAIQSAPGEIDKVVLLSAVPVKHPERLKGELLFIVSQDEPIAQAVKRQYEQAPRPKKLILLAGNAHAQHIFKTENSEKLEQIIVNFLVEKD